jgi:hypothetical protein
MSELGPSSSSERRTSSSREELEKSSAQWPGPPYRRYNLSQVERDKLALEIRATRKAEAIFKQTGEWPDKVEVRGKHFWWLY